jgi:hypothetical protein
VLYHALTGSAPYDDGDSQQLLEQVRAGAPMPIDERETAVPKDLATVVTRAMARDATERYADAGELACGASPRGNSWARMRTRAGSWCVGG